MEQQTSFGLHTRNLTNPAKKKIRVIHDAINGAIVKDLEIQEITKYTLCAIYFGWTPTQLDEEDATLTDYMIEFAAEAKKKGQNTDNGRS